MKNSDKKGFTLIEILIASVIFAMIMIMATGVFSLTSSYNSKIHETRAVLDDARSTASSISDDVRLSNGETKVKIGTTALKVKDLFLISINPNNGNQSFAPEIVTDSPYGSNPYYGLGIVQRSKNKIILYRPRFTNPNYQFYREEFILTDAAWDAGIVINGSPDPNYKLNSDGISMEVRLEGYTKIQDRAQQPYIKFKILAATEYFDTSPVTYRSKIEIQSTVESRDYN